MQTPSTPTPAERWVGTESGAILWYYRGNETGAGVTIDEASNEA